jgi:ATP-dependent 26S proteasome regulatory subunit
VDKIEDRRNMATGHSEADERQLADAWLSAELNRVWIVAERCLRQFQRAQLRPQPDHPSVAEIEGIFTARRTARNSGSTGPLDEAELGRALADCEAKLEPLRRNAPIGRIVENLKLRPLEVETLVVAMAPHIDAPLADVFTLLRGSQMRRGVDLALVSQLFRLKRGERVALLDAVDPERPLIAWKLVQVISHEAIEAYGSVTHRAIQPTFDLLSVLCGRAELPPALQRTTTVERDKPTLDDVALDPEMRAKWQSLCDTAAQAQKEGAFNELPWIMTWGAKGAGRSTLAAKMAAYAGRPMLAFNPLLADKGTLDDLIRRAEREALLRGAVLYVGDIGADLLTDQGRELAKRLVDYPALMVLGIEGMSPPRFRLDHPLQEVPLPQPSEPTRLQLWERFMPAGDRDGNVDLASIARGFIISPGEIKDSAEECRAIAHADKGRKVRHEDLRASVDRRLRNDLGDMAKRLNIVAKWDDLVLDADDMARVQEFISRKLFAHKVYSEWGYGDRIGYGKGMIALFSGPPGTGKTMMAGLISKSLDLDVYQVDLAQVVSKWVGETEKQLAKVFDAAERAHAVLLFDEADSLFAKRTEVKSSNDRYGNLAVNYLLQRLEQYTGVAILTTNKDAALDEALQRRLSLHLHLDIPEPDERERLWLSFMPKKAPTAPGLDFRELAEDFELSGGYIKNAAVRAAFLAAHGAGLITMPILRRAAALELEDMGRVVMNLSTTEGGEKKPRGAKSSKGQVFSS